MRYSSTFLIGHPLFKRVCDAEQTLAILQSKKKRRSRTIVPFCRLKVVKQLRLGAMKKVECKKMQEEGSKKKSIYIPRPKTRKITQTTSKALPKRE
ncbi:hypothetical protein LguiB_008021 [Lonicera macranthoides]